MTDYVELRSERLDEMRERDPDESFDMINLLKFRPTVTEGLGVDGTPGSDAYFRYYAGNVSRIFERLDIAAELLYMHPAHSTPIGLAGEDWDFVAIVRYPSRTKFLAMQDDPQYQDILKFRTGSLINSRLIESVSKRPDTYPTSVGQPVPSETIVSASQPPADPRSAGIGDRAPDEAVCMFNLVRCAEAASGAGVDGLDGGAAYDAYTSGLLSSDIGRRAGLDIVWNAYPLKPLIGPEDELWDQALMVRYPTRQQFTDMARSEGYRRDHGPVRTAALCDSRLVETTNPPAR